MSITIAIVGRPNVGKSTLFNRLTQTRQALVADIPGVTRDRLYGKGEWHQQSFIVIDTGGMTQNNHPIEQLTVDQALQAIAEADIIFFVVDAKVGATPDDFAIAKKLRQLNKPWILVANKNDSNLDQVNHDFYAMGMGEPVGISSTQGHGIDHLLETTLPKFTPLPTSVDTALPHAIQVAMIGRPNVGKSTLINRMLGEERVIVYDQAGTTRDSVSIPFTRQGQDYVLIDTAGIRRRKNIDESIEKFSIVKSLQAIEASHVVIMLLDGQANVMDQDLKLIDFVIETGKALVIAVNKWDGISTDQRKQIRNELARRLFFVDFAETYFISALHGSKVGNLFTAVQKAFQCASKEHPTHTLSTLLEKAIATHNPPLVNGRRIKLRYAHMGGHHPPTIIIHGNQTHALPEDYRRYLAHFYQKKLQLKGTPIRIELREGKNPYAGQKNILTSKQLMKRNRIRKK